MRVCRVWSLGSLWWSAGVVVQWEREGTRPISVGYVVSGATPLKTDSRPSLAPPSCATPHDVKDQQLLALSRRIADDLRYSLGRHSRRHLKSSAVHHRSPQYAGLNYLQKHTKPHHQSDIPLLFDSSILALVQVTFRLPLLLLEHAPSKTKKRLR